MSNPGSPSHPDDGGFPRAPLAPGAAAPDFRISAGAGPAALLSALRGRIVVLVFSPPGWDPVRAEQRPEYNRILRQVPGLDATIIDIGGAGRGAQVDIGDESPLEMPVIDDLDNQGDVARAYGVWGQSALFVVDENGIVRWSHAAPAGAAPQPDVLLAALKSVAPVPGPPEVAPLRSAAGVAALTRRQFVAAAIATALVVAMPLRYSRPDEAQLANPPTDLSARPAAMTSVVLTINGAEHSMELDSRTTLLDALRESVGLTGTKKGCDHGQCGACTVHLDGRRVDSCLVLAAAASGKHVRTIEGISGPTGLHPMQSAFIEHDAFQCGYCTPGQIMSAVAMLSEPWGQSDDDVREAMSGNICRCGAYENILDAVQRVRRAQSGGIA